MSLSEADLGTHADSARYYLLMTQACILSHHPDTLERLDSFIIPYYKKKQNHEKLAEAYYYKAYKCVAQNSIAEAALYYKASEEHARQSDNYRLKYKVAECLAAINEMAGNHVLQLEYSRKALNIAQRARNGEWIAYALCRMAYAHSWLGNTDSILLLMKRVMPYAKYIKRADLPTFLTNAAFPIKDSHPELAKQYLKKSLAMEESSITLEHLADIYWDEGNHDYAYQLWMEALFVNDHNPKDNILQNIVEYDLEHGLTEEQHTLIPRIIHIKDSMLYSLRNDTLKDLQLRFDHEAAMRRQEKVTANWQKGLLSALILILVMGGYIAYRRIREKTRLQEAQMQISDCMSQIRDLEASGEETSDEIGRLNKLIKETAGNKAPNLLRGMALYEQIRTDKTKTLSLAGWTRKDEEYFIEYYAAIEFRTVNKLRKAKRVEELTSHRLFYLLLVEMGKSDQRISELLGISERSVDVLKSRTRLTKKVSE